MKSIVHEKKNLFSQQFNLKIQLNKQIIKSLSAANCQYIFVRSKQREKQIQNSALTT